jgi:hypothetical protein
LRRSRGRLVEGYVDIGVGELLNEGDGRSECDLNRLSFPAVNCALSYPSTIGLVVTIYCHWWYCSVSQHPFVYYATLTVKQALRLAHREARGTQESQGEAMRVCSTRMDRDVVAKRSNYATCKHSLALMFRTSPIYTLRSHNLR